MADTTESMQELRICLVGPIAPPAGGMANQTKQLLDLLKSEGAKVDFVAVNAPYKPRLIGKVPGVRAIFRLFPFLVNLFQATGKAQVLHIMANSGWSWHLFAAPAIWIARWRGTPVIVNYRGGHADSFFAKSWSVVNASLRHANMIMVPSLFLQQVFNHYQQSQSAVPVSIVPNILNQKLFYPNASKLKLIKDNTLLTKSATNSGGTQPHIKAPHFIVTRNLEDIYNVATCISAFALVYRDNKKAKLTIAGTGPLLSALQQQVQQLGLLTAVQFAGRLSIEQMAKLYRTADIMLNSSLVDNSPNSIIESLACGVPVISSNVGGISHLVRHGHDALLFKAGDHEAMYQLINKLLCQPALYQNLVRNGLASCQRFHWSAVKQQLCHQYQNAIQDQGKTA